MIVSMLVAYVKGIEILAPSSTIQLQSDNPMYIQLTS